METCHTKDSLTKPLAALAHLTQSARWPWKFSDFMAALAMPAVATINNATVNNLQTAELSE